MTQRTRGVGAEHEQRRGRIVDAALAISAEQGIAAVTQTRVAAAAGVSPGRVQHYFPSMTGLLGEAFDRLNTASTARIRDLLGLAPGQGFENVPARRVLEAVLGELIPHDAPTRAHLQFRQSFTALGLAHREVAARLREQYQQLHEHDLAGLIRRDQHDGLIDPARDPVVTGRGLAALAEGLAYYVLINAIAPEQARVQVHDAMAALYAGVEVPQPPPAAPAVRYP